MIDGKAMADMAREHAETARQGFISRWEAKLRRCELARAARDEAEALLRPLIADFVAASPGMRFDAERLWVYVGGCHVASVWVTCTAPAKFGFDILPQWPAESWHKDQEFHCKDMEEFQKVFAKQMARFF